MMNSQRKHHMARLRQPPTHLPWLSSVNALFATKKKKGIMTKSKLSFIL